MSVYKGHPDLFIFVDETGADRRDSMRKFGYSLRGQPAVANKLLFRGHVSAIAAISFDSGLLDCSTVIGSVTGDEFLSFIQKSLVPNLQPFDGKKHCCTGQCKCSSCCWSGGHHTECRSPYPLSPTIQSRPQCH